MLNEVVEACPTQSKVIIDCTSGGGGHSEAMIKAHHPETLLCHDRDSEAIAFLNEKFEAFSTGQAPELIKSKFSDIRTLRDPQPCWKGRFHSG